MKIAGLSLDTPFVLAPMAGVTSPAFRLMARRAGASLVYTEMVSAAGLVRRRPKTLELTQVLARERPVALQLFGGDPQTMYQAALMVDRLEGVDLVDVNLGCPVRKIRRQGAGSALLDDPARAAQVVAAVRQATAKPVSVKLRLGYREDRLESILPPVLEAGACLVCLHARTVKQGFAGRADWSAIARLKSWCPVPVIGNGDVRTPQEALDMLEQTGCDLVMIGRASLGNPWIFEQAADLWAGRPLRPVSLARRRRALWEHMELARSLGGRGQAMHFMRQFMMWYSKGLPDSAAFRRRAGQARELEELIQISTDYFERLERAA